MDGKVFRRELDVIEVGDDAVGPDVKETQRRHPEKKLPSFV